MGIGGRGKNTSRKEGGRGLEPPLCPGAACPARGNGLAGKLVETGLGLSPPGEIIRSKYTFTFTRCDEMLERLSVFSKPLFIGIPGFVISGNPVMKW